jgi:phage tail sheath protein FI
MPTYRTPGVYVEEISIFPPSVAEVETAVPAFVGYTEKARGEDGADLTNFPTRITSLLEFESLFGKGPVGKIEKVELDPDGAFLSAKVVRERHLYDSLRLFFENGGGKCYIVSIGGLGAAPNEADFTKGLEQVKKFDEPTILLFPDATKLTQADLAKVQTNALGQCASLMDRVAILDTRSEDNAPEAFRNALGIDNLKYGAAYAPWLRITHPKGVGLSELQALAQSNNLLRGGTPVGAVKDLTTDGAIRALLSEIPGRETLAASAEAEVPGKASDVQLKLADVQAARAALNTARQGTDNAAIAAAETALTTKETALNTAMTALRDTQNKAANLRAKANSAEQDLRSAFAVYDGIIRGIDATPTDCPPSGAIAGIYARVDAARGVWKAPANVSINGVLGPSRHLPQTETDQLNIDVVAGKSINAILAFSGKGTLVWGARTLAGNDNEWRYVPVRRFFNMVEESVKKSTSWAVFEPNDANTWTKVRGMIENYLTQKWREGALAGATAKDAFFVRCGLGITMTAQDILEGRMIVEIGMAAVRPAEFIILKFSHKLQTS